MNAFAEELGTQLARAHRSAQQALADGDDELAAALRGRMEELRELARRAGVA